MIRVIVNGAKGKMGQETVKAVQAAAGLHFVAGLDHQDPLAPYLNAHQVDVVVDFTRPTTIFDNISIILGAGCHAVVGTTGLTSEQLSALHQKAKQGNQGLIVCPNFAIGAILMMKLASKAAKYMPRVEIIEYHHDQKADAPSGTAIKTAELIQAAQPRVNEIPLQETELIKGARGGKKGSIPIHSIRVPGVIANQEVILGGLGQTLTLRHDTCSREAFMPGVILCIKKVVETSGLIYGLENILED